MHEATKTTKHDRMLASQINGLAMISLDGHSLTLDDLVAIAHRRRAGGT